MIKKLLYSPSQLDALNRQGRCIIVDCRFALTDPEKGRNDWFSEHIPGACYAHLDDDLAAPVTELSGRHPLPGTQEFAGFLASIGWMPDKLLVAYDDASNAIAARLWWLMRYFGQSASLLDGGFTAWKKAGLSVESGPEIMMASDPVTLTPDPELVVSTDDILRELGSGQIKVMDARAAERFSGKVEPLDTRAGHIPGATNRPFQLNLDENSCFKAPELLAQEFKAFLEGRKPGDVAHSCGSGVTACHNYFAMELAGLSAARLYPGSWSEWIRDPDRPIETGPEQ